MDQRNAADGVSGDVSIVVAAVEAGTDQDIRAINKDIVLRDRESRDAETMAAAKGSSRILKKWLSVRGRAKRVHKTLYDDCQHARIFEASIRPRPFTHSWIRCI